MVAVVLEAPGLVGENERHEGDGPNDILHKFVSRKGLVGTIVADHKKLHPIPTAEVSFGASRPPTLLEVILCNCVEF